MAKTTVLAWTCVFLNLCLMMVYFFWVQEMRVHRKMRRDYWDALRILGDMSKACCLHAELDKARAAQDWPRYAQLHTQAFQTTEAAMQELLTHLKRDAEMKKEMDKLEAA